MPIITMFSGSFCEEGPVVREIISRTGYRHIVDDEIVAEASRRVGFRPKVKLNGPLHPEPPCSITSPMKRSAP